MNRFGSHISIQRSHRSHIRLCPGEFKSDGTWFLASDHALWKYRGDQLLWQGEGVSGQIIGNGQYYGGIHSPDFDLSAQLRVYSDSDEAQETLRTSFLPMNLDEHHLVGVIPGPNGQLYCLYDNIDHIPGGAISGDNVIAFDRQGNQLYRDETTEVSTGGSAMAADRAGNLYVTASGGSNMYVRSIAPSGGTNWEIEYADLDAHFPIALSYDNKKLYVAGKVTGSLTGVLFWLDPSTGTLVGSTDFTGDAQFGRTSLDVSLAGEVVLGVDNRVYKVAADLSAKELFYTGTNNIHSLAVDTEGSVYIRELTPSPGLDADIYKISPAGIVEFNVFINANNESSNDLSVHPGKVSLLPLRG